MAVAISPTENKCPDSVYYQIDSYKGNSEYYSGSPMIAARWWCIARPHLDTREHGFNQVFMFDNQVKYDGCQMNSYEASDHNSVDVVDAGKCAADGIAHQRVKRSFSEYVIAGK